MTIEELAKYSGISEKQIRKRYKEIAGYEEKDGEISFPAGTRYMYNLRRTRLDTMGEKCDTLLKATYENKFIDHEKLKMEQTSFDSLIAELVHEGYLRENGTKNLFGANRYDTTVKYDKELKDKSKEKRLKIIEHVIASLSSVAIRIIA